MLENSKLVYLFLYVNDLQASRDFYERKLGLRVLEDDEVSVKYDAGEIILALNKARDYGIEVGRRDDTSIIVFHAADIDALRASLERRGVEFAGPTDRYDIGATAMFYDPDGHCLSLYQPSEESMHWPSADKIRAVLSAGANGSRPPAAGPAQDLTLAQSKLIYLFLFVKDVRDSFRFYHEKLGLRVLEESEEAGVVKYDGGGLILATHLFDSEVEARVRREDLDKERGIAPVFLVPDIDLAYRELASRGVGFVGDVQRSEIGAIVKLEDPTKHLFYLYQASPEAMGWPSGSKIERLAAQQL